MLNTGSVNRNSRQTITESIREELGYCTKHLGHLLNGKTTSIVCMCVVSENNGEWRDTFDKELY